MLAQAIADRQVDAAVLHVRQGGTAFTRHFGKVASVNAMFLLGSISKPICVTALMTLFDRGEFRLDDPLKKFIPEFTGDGRDDVTLRQLLTHVSGLPSHVPENLTLRKNHASLEEFVDHAIRTPLQFVPGERYQYSSMGILLATRVAELISGVGIREFVDQTVFKPLLTRSAQGLGRFQLEDMVLCQTEHAAPEAGGGDPAAKDWDWNSPFWRKLGAPWGGTHSSALDLGRFLDRFMWSGDRGFVKSATARLMVSNQNAPGLTPRGLGFNVGSASGSPGCSERTFGHTGSTGTIAWDDPSTKKICVVLTSLPGGAVKPHPREVAAKKVADAATVD